MSAILVYPWACPFCGFVNKASRELDSPYIRDKEVTYCDGDEGGCDRMVVLVSTVTVTAKAYKVVDAEEDVDGQGTTVCQDA